MIDHGEPLPPPAALRSTRRRLDGPPDSPTSSPPPAGAMATPEEEGVDEEGFCCLYCLACQLPLSSGAEKIAITGGETMRLVIIGFQTSISLK